MVDNQIKLGYWKIRGFSFFVRQTLEYLKVPYTVVDYEQGEGPQFSRECWNSVKYNLGLKFPNLPYLIDGDFNLTETLAIIRYLCSKYDKSLLGNNAQDSGDVDCLLLLLHEYNGQYTVSPAYRSDDKQAIGKQACENLKRFVDFLGDKQYLVGDYITAPDLYMIELIDRIQFLADDTLFQFYPKLQQYSERLNEIPQIKSWKNSTRWFKQPYNNKSAKLKN